MKSALVDHGALEELELSGLVTHVISRDFEFPSSDICRDTDAVRVVEVRPCGVVIEPCESLQVLLLLLPPTGGGSQWGGGGGSDLSLLVRLCRG